MEAHNMFTSLVEKAEAYGKTNLELLKLKAVDKTAGTVSSIVVYVVVAFLLAMCLIIASIGISLWLGELMGKYYYGFFAVAGFYAVIGIIFYAARESLLKKPVANTIIEKALN